MSWFREEPVMRRNVGRSLPEVVLAMCLALVALPLATGAAVAEEPPAVALQPAEVQPVPEASAVEQPSVDDEPVALEEQNDDADLPAEPQAAEEKPQVPTLAKPRDPYAEQPAEEPDAGDLPGETSPEAASRVADRRRAASVPPAPEPAPLAPAELPTAPHATELKPVETQQQPAKPGGLDPASLDGVHPGHTTRAELHEKWGVPVRAQRIAGGTREVFQLEKLGRVQVTVLEDVVQSLTVQIDKPLAVDAVVERLAIGEIEPVPVVDEQGEVLGAAYPECGVLLGYLPRSKPARVFQIVVEAVDAQPFLLRAEARMTGFYAKALADTDQALALSPDYAQAYHLRGEVLLRCGRLDEALAAAQRAADLEPQVAGHRLLVARALAAAGDYPAAITCVRGVMDEPQISKLDAARAACLWGDFLSHWYKRDFAEAIEFHQRAIALAEPLLSAKDRATRREAKQVLLDAHLGVAYDIGHGRWQQKTAAVAKWIDRAAVFADDLMRKEGATSQVRLKVYAGALAAIAGVEEPPDVSRWVAGTRQLGQRLYEASADPMNRAEIAWQLGRALSDAVAIETARGNSDEAFNLGSLARALLEEAEPLAERLPIYHYECGKLCYRVGLVYAVEREDHAQAVVWFDRATPLLESPVPAAAIDAGVQGETFVSMAVSYWEQENKEEALRLTSQGLKLMEQAVEDKTLDPAALAVPYGNLAAMHEDLGDSEQAKWCADLARRYEESATK
jgi:tetratricopeptide (TPR) repeat protein